MTPEACLFAILHNAYLPVHAFHIRLASSERQLQAVQHSAWTAEAMNKAKNICQLAMLSDDVMRRPSRLASWRITNHLKG
jgi:hypothetical protein